MRPVRIIQSSTYKYKYISIAQSPTKMAVRILVPTNQEPNCSGTAALETEAIQWRILNIDGQGFQVAAEGIFDLNNPLHRSWFQPNANICFVVNRALSRGALGVAPVQAFCLEGEKTPDFCMRTGYDVVAQLYCWSCQDSITESPASFAVATDGGVFTNIKPERIRMVDTEWMKRPDRSAFLTITHKIEAIGEKDRIILKVSCFDNEGNPISVDGIYRVEATAGYLPVNELLMVDGHCEFAWIPLGIAGGKVTIKLKDSQNYIRETLTFNLKSN